MKIYRATAPACWLMLAALALTSCGHLSSSNSPEPQEVWTTLGSITDGRVNGLTWFSAGYVAVASNGAVLISEDGFEWDERTRDRLTPLYDVAFSGSRYVAVGPLMYSATNVRTWNRNQATITQNLNSVVWSGSRFVAVGNAGKVTYSTDGLVWAPAQSPTTENLHDVHWSGSRFIAVGEDGAVIVSDDGVNWSIALAPAVSQPDLIAVTSGDGAYVAVGANGAVMRSTSGTTWTSESSGTAQWLVDIGYNGSSFVAVGLAGTVITSSNGTAWNSQLVQSNTDLWVISSENPQLLIAGGEDGTVVYRAETGVK